MEDIVRSKMACAACKYMGEDCADNCPFSPYFSPDEPEKLAAVDKVFGKDQFRKLVRDVPVETRAEAVNSLVYEATLRTNDPVSGCRGVIAALDRRVKFFETRLMNDRIRVCIGVLRDPIPPRPSLPPYPIPRTKTPPSTLSKGATGNSALCDD